MESSHDPALHRIAEKMARSERLNQADGEALFASGDLHGLGRLAHGVRTQLHGRTVFYNVNRHINYTNVCVLRCRFCGFRRAANAPDAYDLSLDEAVGQACQARDAGATEVHIVGGLHPHWPLEHYVQMVRRIHDACPSLHIKAFTAIEIAHFAQLAGRSVEQVLRDLMAVGLGSLPGGGAEVFSHRVHAEAFAGKVGAQEWFAVHETAHRLGLRSNATMLYGHVETAAERVAHLLRLRDLQDRTGGLQAFVPLSFNPAGSDLSHLPGPTGLDDLRTVAVARLMLDNVPHVKTFWVMTGAKVAQLSLLFGADDLDGTVSFYDITHRDGAGTRQEMTVEQIHSLVRNVGLDPVERDTLYRPVVRDSALPGHTSK